jgi:pimeloyl-ACP methyl ester carboxylesterase
LAALGWEVTAVDLAAHGRGPRPTGEIDLAGVAEHAAQALPQDLTVLVGHSLGAIVALLAAARHPGLARGLVLEEPPSCAQLNLELVAKGVEAQAEAVRSDRDAYWRHVRHDNPLWSDTDVDSAVESLEVLDVASILRVLRATQRWDLPQLVLSAAVPLLVIAAPAPSGPGTALGGTALNGSERGEVRRILPDERFVVIEGGHSLHREQPERVTALVSEFAQERLS